eukprot:jgi/Mesen1/9938/ME000070S09224
MDVNAKQWRLHAGSTPFHSYFPLPAKYHPELGSDPIVQQTLAVLPSKCIENYFLHRHVSARLLTRSTMWLSVAPAMSAYVAASLGFDVRLLPSLLGLRLCTDLLFGTSFPPPLNEQGRAKSVPPNTAYRFLSWAPTSVRCATPGGSSSSTEASWGGQVDRGFLGHPVAAEQLTPLTLLGLNADKVSTPAVRIAGEGGAAATSAGAGGSDDGPCGIVAALCSLYDACTDVAFEEYGKFSPIKSSTTLTFVLFLLRLPASLSPPVTLYSKILAANLGPDADKVCHLRLCLVFKEDNLPKSAMWPPLGSKKFRMEMLPLWPSGDEADDKLSLCYIGMLHWRKRPLNIMKHWLGLDPHMRLRKCLIVKRHDEEQITFLVRSVREAPSGFPVLEVVYYEKRRTKRLASQGRVDYLKCAQRVLNLFYEAERNQSTTEESLHMITCKETIRLLWLILTRSKHLLEPSPWQRGQARRPEWVPSFIPIVYSEEAASIARPVPASSPAGMISSNLSAPKRNREQQATTTVTERPNPSGGDSPGAKAREAPQPPREQSLRCRQVAAAAPARRPWLGVALE